MASTVAPIPNNNPLSATSLFSPTVTHAPNTWYSLFLSQSQPSLPSSPESNLTSINWVSIHSTSQNKNVNQLFLLLLRLALLYLICILINLQIQTKDGFLLGLQRVSSSSPRIEYAHAAGQRGPPVLLLHGLFMVPSLTHLNLPFITSLQLIL